MCGTRLRRVAEILPAADADAARWLLLPDVDWWDLVRYGPPGFDVYVRIAFRHDSETDVVYSSGESAVDAVRAALATLASSTSTLDRGFAAICEGWMRRGVDSSSAASGIHNLSALRHERKLLRRAPGVSTTARPSVSGRLTVASSQGGHRGLAGGRLEPCCRAAGRRVRQCGAGRCPRRLHRSGRFPHCHLAEPGPGSGPPGPLKPVANCDRRNAHLHRMGARYPAAAAEPGRLGPTPADATGVARPAVAHPRPPATPGRRPLRRHHRSDHCGHPAADGQQLVTGLPGAAGGAALPDPHVLGVRRPGAHR